MDSRRLYQEVILDHNKKPRNYGQLAAPSHKAEGVNPLCGDHIWVSLKVGDERIDEIAFEGQSCAICKASASMMTSAVKGKTVLEAEFLVDGFRAMVTGSAEPGPEFKRLSVFAGIRDLPSRVKCAVLPWHTLHAAFTSQATATTEGDADPAASA